MSTGLRNGQQIQVEARCEHEDGYELTAIPVVAFLMQYNKVRRPGLYMMGHLAEPTQLFEVYGRQSNELCGISFTGIHRKEMEYVWDTNRNG